MKLKVPGLIIILILVLSCKNLKETKLSPDAFVFSAVSALSEYKSNCESDSKKLWGVSLCVPMVILNRETMTAVATMQDPKGRLLEKKGLWIGKYVGPKVYANTSFEWGNQNWSMVLWPLPETPEERSELLMHEAWHSVQALLEFPVANVFLEHLDDYDGRLLMRMEWQALLSALQDSDRRRVHLKNALVFRSLRFKRYPKAQVKERTLDWNEGLAAYTGAKFRQERTHQTYKYLESKLNSVPEIPSLARSASYYTGPLYGLVLDSLSRTWKNNLKRVAGFGELAKEFVGNSKEIQGKMPGEKFLLSYKYAEIKEFEESRKLQREALIKKYMTRFKKKNSIRIRPTPGSPNMFDPRKILALSESDLIYLTYETSDRWGRLKVTDGARIKSIGKSTVITLSPKNITSGNTASGEGWSIEFEKGWGLKKNQDGFYEPALIN